MYVVVIGTIILAYIVYRQIKWYFSPFRAIPAPYEYPILSHYPYFMFRKIDTLNLIRKWGEDFKDYGMFRFRTINSQSDYTVCLLKPELFKFVFSRPDAFVRPNFFKKYFPLTGDGLLTATGSQHIWQKKMLSKMFSLAQTKHYISVFNKHTSVMIQLWKSLIDNETQSENIDIKSYTNNLSFDIIGETAFGYHFNSQTAATNPITQGFRDTIKGVLDDKSLILLKVFPFLKYAPFGPAKVLKDVRKSAETLLERIFQNRLEKAKNGTLTETEQNDLLNMLINSTDDKNGQGFTEGLIKDNAYTFIVAGHETTSSTLPGVLYYLAKYPKYQEKCCEEIKNVLNGNEDFSFEDLNKLSFTTAVLKECLRLFATIPFIGRICTRDMVVGGHTFPKGTHLLLALFIGNEDDQEFDDEHQFKPERYLYQDDNSKTGTSFTFGYGPYGCIGKHFAMQELKVIMVRLLQNFRLTIDPECEQFYRRVKVTILFNPPLKIRIHALT